MQLDGKRLGHWTSDVWDPSPPTDIIWAVMIVWRIR